MGFAHRLHDTSLSSFYAKITSEELCDIKKTIFTLQKYYALSLSLYIYIYIYIMFNVIVIIIFFCFNRNIKKASDMFG